MPGNTLQNNPDNRQPSPKKGGEAKIVLLFEKDVRHL